MLEDCSDNDENDKNHRRLIFLNQQVVSVDDKWTKKILKDENKFIKSINKGEATLLETEENETPFLNFNQQQSFSPDRSRSVNQPDDNQQFHETNIFSTDNLDTNIKNINSNLKSNNKPLSSPTRTKTNTISSPIHTSTLPTKIKTQKPITKIPIRSNSLSQPKSHNSTNKQQSSSSTINKGAFHFFTTDDQQTRISSKLHSPLKDDRKRITSSEDDDLETNNLKEDELKLRLKKEKQYGKKTGELLNKLHENYEELLEKYAQAENTIDQLRFQPRIFGDNTPRSNTSEHVVHVIQQPKTSIITLRSSGTYGSPLSSSIRPVPSTTTTTPARKSISPTSSGTNGSVVLDEVVQEFIIPETSKLDLIIEIKTLEDKMKSFLTLMNENQLDLTEQKHVYGNIKEDYDKLINVLDQNKHDTDLNNQLEIMKKLLNEIVKRITGNLFSKPLPDSKPQDISHTSSLSTQSSLCNHNELMGQYQKLLNVINTNKNSPTESEIINELENDSKQLKTISQDSPRLDEQFSTKTKQKPYIYISGDSDDEQQQQQTNGIPPIQFAKSIQSTLYELDYIPSPSVKQHQYKIEEQNHKQKKPINNQQSNPIIPIDNTRYSNTSVRTHGNTFDSGIGTNSLTKLRYDNKLFTNRMDESHFQSLDDEQESISSSSLRSNGSGSASPGSPHSKYSKRFDNRSSYRRKPSGHSDSDQSDIETHITDSFDLIPQSLRSNKKMPRSYHTWKAEKPSISHHSRLTPMSRSTSIGTHEIKDYQSSLTAPYISSKINTNHSFSHQQTRPKTYRSSIYINQIHTNKRFRDKIEQNQSNNLYYDRQTGTIYRYESEKTSNPTKISYQSSAQTKLYRCAECGSVTTYYHRHHIDSKLKQVTTHLEDLGYESGYKKRTHRYRYIDYYSSSSSSSSSSDSDSDINSNYLAMIALNQAYNRAEKVQDRSQSLSRYITRQLKLALASI